MKGGRRCSSHPAAAGIRVAGGGLNPDPLAPPDWFRDWPRPRRHHRRLTLAVLLGAAFLAGSLAGRTLASTPRPGAQSIPAPHPSDPPALVVGRQPDPERRTRSSNRPTVTARPWPAAGVLSGRTNAGSGSGIASTYGPGYDGLTASRWPRGTVLRICGPGGCFTRTTNDYGPAKRTGRIMDLDVRTFEAVCGCSWRRGLVRVTVGLVG